MTLLTQLNPYRDGIALALGINDKRMKVRPCGPAERGAQGGVRVRVWCENKEQQR